MNSSNRPVIKFYTSLEDLIYNSDTEEDETEMEIEDQPYDMVDIDSTHKLLEHIAYIKKYKLYKNGKNKIFNSYLCKVEEPLKEIDDMIGMNKIKSDIVQIIFTMCSNLKKKKLGLLKKDSEMFMGSLIYGRPGMGKTTIIHLLAKLYLKLGITQTNNIIKGSRSNMIAGYVGQTAPKTLKLLTKAIGGVLVLDEIYQLGGWDKDKDHFSKECMETLNQFMSEHPEVPVFGCGYKNEIQLCLLNKNPGFDRRFPNKYHIQNKWEGGK